jgi:hypothetical protein
LTRRRKKKRKRMGKRGKDGDYQGWGAAVGFRIQDRTGRRP